MADIPDSVLPFDVPPEPDVKDDAPEGLTFEDKMLDRVKEGIEAGESHLRGFHRECVSMHSAYHNAREYEGLRKKNKFPVPVLQKCIDCFVADTQDKLWYAGEPCSFVPREDNDKPDAEAKQGMMTYQDDEEGLYNKTAIWLRDCGLYRMCAAQVDYDEQTHPVWREEPVFEYAFAPDGSLMVDEKAQPMYATDEEGKPIQSGKHWVRREEVFYRGAKVKRVDPQNVLFAAEKCKMDDEYPIMVRSQLPKSYFVGKDYFYNTEKIEDAGGENADKGVAADKRRTRGFGDGGPAGPKKYEYVEWQGQVNKGQLYNWLSQSRPDTYEELVPFKLYAEKWDDPDGDTIKQIIEIRTKYDKCWCICGVVARQTVVRLDVNPFDGPNVVVGFMSSDEEGLAGMGLGEKIKAIHDGMQDTMGMLLENLKQTVNAMWVINKAMLVNQKGIVVNKPGAIYETNGPVNDAVKRIEQQRVSPDLHILMTYLDQWGKDATGLQSPITGEGDRAAETLGEFSQVMAQATLRMRDYLKSFEDSFIKPLYRLRLDVNSLYIDTEYAYRILGDKGQEWRKIQPHSVRTDVDLICQSSTRETQKAVVIQQILQLAKIAPLAISAGQPVRMDKLGARLCEVGFNWSEDMINDIWPLLAMEKEQGSEAVNKMLAENAMLAMAAMRQQLLTGMAMGMSGMSPADAPQGGGNLPHPTSEGDAIKSANARNSTRLAQEEPI